MAVAIPTTCQGCGRQWPSKRSARLCGCRTSSQGPDLASSPTEIGQGATQTAGRNPRATESAGREKESTRELPEAERGEVLRVTEALVQVLRTELGMSLVGATRAVRWAAHVIEGRNEK